MTNQFHVTPKFVQSVKDCIKKLIEDGKILVKKPVEVKVEIEVTPSPKFERPIPKCFVCPLAKRIMTDPVMISTGNTFERQALLDFFTLKGHIDPLTNESVDEMYIEANVYLKKSIESYVLENPVVLPPEPVLVIPVQ